MPNASVADSNQSGGREAGSLTTAVVGSLSATVVNEAAAGEPLSNGVANVLVAEVSQNAGEALAPLTPTVEEPLSTALVNATTVVGPLSNDIANATEAAGSQTVVSAPGTLVSAVVEPLSETVLPTSQRNAAEHYAGQCNNSIAESVSEAVTNAAVAEGNQTVVEAPERSRRPWWNRRAAAVSNEGTAEELLSATVASTPAVGGSQALVEEPVALLPAVVEPLSVVVVDETEVGKSLSEAVADAAATGESLA